MSAGRLNIDEYGERSAQVSTAKTRGELRALFADLPPPHPQFSTGAAPAPQPLVPQRTQQVGTGPRNRPTRAVLAGILPLAIVAAIALDISLHMWIFFLIPVAVMMFGSSMYGRNWRNDHRRDYRDRERDYRDRRR
jgi:hypothetical protein